MNCKTCKQPIPYNPYNKSVYCCKSCEDKDTSKETKDLFDFLGIKK